MTPAQATWGALPLSPPTLLFPVARQEDAPVPSPAPDPVDGPSRQTLLLSGGAFAFIPFTFLLLFYVCMRREFKRSLLRRHQAGLVLRAASHGGDVVMGGGTDSRGRAVPPPSGSGGGGSSKRQRYGDADAVASALAVKPLPEGATTACAICLDESHPDRTEAGLACGHTYHGACIRQWLAKADSCPLCALPVRDALFAAAEKRGWGGGGGSGGGLGAPMAEMGDDVTVPIDDDDEPYDGGTAASTGAASGAAMRTAAGPSGVSGLAGRDGGEGVAAAAVSRPPAMAPDTVVMIRPSGFDHPPVVPPPVAAAVPSV